ncbi:MAG: hypothetical protein KGL39_55195 [Patescibacteria group bacterium]|nr:hypothetical protein [Patescibacteria group bacterium]
MVYLHVVWQNGAFLNSGNHSFSEDFTSLCGQYGCPTHMELHSDLENIYGDVLPEINARYVRLPAPEDELTPLSRQEG